ncbi:MAG: hypothetical protein ACLGGX_05040 [Bdellovibrionia bacterium]
MKLLIRLEAIIMLGVLGFAHPCFSQSSSAPSAAEDVDEKKLKEPETAETIDVVLEFTYSNFPLTIKAYEFNKGKRGVAGRWRVTSDLASLPLGSEITGKPYKIKKGVDRLFMMVVENNTDQDHYFYAAPHDTNPSENSIGNKLFCLCYGHVFKVPAKSYWSRVGQLSIHSHSLGSKITFQHRVIGISPADVKEHMKRTSKSRGAGG